MSGCPRRNINRWTVSLLITILAIQRHDAFLIPYLSGHHSEWPSVQNSQRRRTVDSRSRNNNNYNQFRQRQTRLFMSTMDRRQTSTSSYYSLMGVSSTADAAEIKRAYRKLAKKYHPDANPDQDTTSMFQKLNEAYEVLKDPEKRKRYDQRQQQHHHHHRHVGSPFRGGGGVTSYDIFNSVYGGTTGDDHRRWGPRDDFSRQYHDFYPPPPPPPRHHDPYNPFFHIEEEEDATNRRYTQAYDNFQQQQRKQQRSHEGAAKPRTTGGGSSKRPPDWDRKNAHTHVRSSPNNRRFTEPDFRPGMGPRGGAFDSPFEPGPFGPSSTSAYEHADIHIGAPQQQQQQWRHRAQSPGRSTARRVSPNPVVGNDLRMDVRVDLQTAVFGGQQTVDIPYLAKCPSCRKAACSTCQGRGRVMDDQTCPACNGAGGYIADSDDESCARCGGQGVKPDTKQVVVTIPAGVESGTRLLVPGEGDYGRNGGPAGDLYLFVRVIPNEEFIRQGSDIYSSESVSFADALLGSSIPCRVIDGQVTVRIEPGTQSGQVIRLRGRGAPKIGRGRGDHYVTIVIETLQDLTPEEEKLVQRLKELIERRRAGDLPPPSSSNNLWRGLMGSELLSSLTNKERLQKALVSVADFFIDDSEKSL